MAREFLIVDMQRVLDESQVGKDASVVLEAQMKAAQEEFKKLQDKHKSAKGDALKAAEAQAIQFEQKSIADLEARRKEMRDELVARARPIMSGLAMSQGAKLVLERTAVIIFDPNGDVTADVIARVDAQGPLKAVKK